MTKVIRLSILLIFLLKVSATGKTHPLSKNASGSNAMHVFPTEGRVLNYRIIGFTFPPEDNIQSYCVKIATDRCDGQEEFDRKLIMTLETRKNTVIGEVPFWARHYTWQVEYMDQKGNITESPFYHFTTLWQPDLDTSHSKLEVLKTTDEFGDAFVFLDTSRTLYDMKGNAVWYLPDLDNTSIETKRIRDLKMTNQGTITFMIAHEEHGTAYEIDYDGDVLWKATGPYDHEFTKLENGHYMLSACGVKQLEWRYFSRTDSGLYIATDQPDTGRKYTARKCMKGSFGQLLEMDSHHNVVWSWSEADYYKGKDVRNHIERDETTYLDTVEDHQNSFYFDEKKKIIYVSYINTNSILKLRYPSGDVIAVYNGKMPRTPKQRGAIEPSFCWQHSCRLTDDGHLCLYNNNLCNRDSAPQILVLGDTVFADGSFNTLWQFDCPMSKKKGEHPNGGNVMQLPNHTFFISMCAPYSRMFIVCRDDRQVLWEARYWKPIRRPTCWSLLPFTSVPRLSIAAKIWTILSGKARQDRR
jgi:hypothetical protein